MFAKVISRQQKSLLARIELKIIVFLYLGQYMRFWYMSGVCAKASKFNSLPTG